MAEPANRKDRPGGGKYYLHPLTGEEFDSVTTVLESWDKDGLKIWSAMLAADMAMDSVPLLIHALARPDCGNTFNRCYEKHGRANRCERCPCGECGRCWWRRMAWHHAAESSRRADEGTELHAAANYWVLSGGDHQSIRVEVAPYYETFLVWAADYGLGPSGFGDSWVQTEITLINRRHMYAGTSDAAVRITRNTPKAIEFLDRLGLPEALVRVDYKTREKPDESLYNDMPLQGIAYERCDTVLLPDGNELPAVPTDARAVLQLRPGQQYSFKPMVSSDLEFQAFLGLLAAHRWRLARGDKKAFDPALVSPAPPQVPRQSAAALAAASPVKAATKRAPAKKTTTPAEQFTRNGRDPWPAGYPNVSALNDEIPF